MEYTRSSVGNRSVFIDYYFWNIFLQNLSNQVKQLFNDPNSKIPVHMKPLEQYHRMRIEMFQFIYPLYASVDDLTTPTYKRFINHPLNNIFLYNQLIMDQRSIISTELDVKKSKIIMDTSDDVLLSNIKGFTFNSDLYDAASYVISTSFFGPQPNVLGINKTVFELNFNEFYTGTILNDIAKVKELRYSITFNNDKINTYILNWIQKNPLNKNIKITIISYTNFVHLLLKFYMLNERWIIRNFHKENMKQLCFMSMIVNWYYMRTIWKILYFPSIYNEGRNYEIETVLKLMFARNIASNIQLSSFDYIEPADALKKEIIIDYLQINEKPQIKFFEIFVQTIKFI